MTKATENAIGPITNLVYHSRRIESKDGEQDMPAEKSPRILITRLSHIGDCILTLPMVVAIRKRHPEAYIAWAVESPSHQLLELHPAINELIMIPKGWATKPGCWRGLSQQLRKPKFEIAIDPQGITKSAALGRMSGAKMRIGIRGRWGRELSPYLNNSLIETTAPHLVDRSLELLSAIGIRTRKAEFQLPVCSASDQKTTGFLAERKIANRFSIINPGASWASKRWVTDRFADVAKHLFRKHGIRSVITWAGKEELKMAARIQELAPASSVVAEPTSLKEFAAMCRHASFFIGCDTGPLHIATAMGTPCIGLYGSTRPEESGAFGPQHIAIQKWYQAGSCRERRTADNKAMRDIRISDVTSAVDQMVLQLANARLHRTAS